MRFFFFGVNNAAVSGVQSVRLMSGVNQGRYLKLLWQGAPIKRSYKAEQKKNDRVTGCKRILKFPSRSGRLPSLPDLHLFKTYENLIF